VKGSQVTNFASRAFEHTLHAPYAKAKGEHKEVLARKFYYERLMQVSIRHSYYNKEHDDCPDFSIYPTASSVALMKNIGLLFREEGTGFSILYDVRRKDIFLNYLRRQAAMRNPASCWVRLSFVLSLDNPYFVNFTNIPIDLNPATRNFYITNQEAQRLDGEVVFDFDPSTFDQTLPVVPVQVQETVSKEIEMVQVRDISGDVVLCKPRCVQKGLLELKQPSAITCDDVENFHPPNPLSPPEWRCTETIYLDFSRLSEDKYSIEQVPYLSSPDAVVSSDVLYTAAYPMPLCFIDLLFTDPTGADSDIYPVRNLFSIDAEIETVNYVLKFEARETFWNYYIVPPANETILDLKIEGEPPIRFAGPCCVFLPNGTQAYRFVSTKALPFRQQSKFHFQLTGEPSTTSQKGVLIDRLPVAAVEQVLQDEVTALLGLEKTICPRARGGCRKLQRQLGKCLCAGLPFDLCLQEIRQICKDPQSKECQDLKRCCSTLYSDTYVYV
jgi:hypothetical protein